MATQIDIRELAAAVKAKRGNRGLRAVAEEIGEVSASTLSRVEQGKIPDLDSYMRICHWLGMPADHFRRRTGGEEAPAHASEMSTRDMVAAHLKADRTLDPDTSEALIKMIRFAYEAMGKGEIGKGE
ncbi:MAG TPA: helix-turn-helix transcriptional regulator [Armatimonadota bacterium]|jgi:transcriptional regulator with XRE-family HTH domain